MGEDSDYRSKRYVRALRWGAIVALLSLAFVFQASAPLGAGSSNLPRVTRAADLEAIPDYNWFPGYYVLNHEDTASSKRAILNDPLVEPFTGVQFRYHWAASEKAPRDYSAGFANLDRDLRRVAAKRKKIIVMLMYKKFDGTSSVPADLRTAAGPWCSGRYCGELTNGSGTSIALLWNPVVQARLKAWIRAMARHVSRSRYRDIVAGIVLNETALGTTDTRILRSADYDPEVYIQALKDNMRVALIAAPRLITILYYEGGFVSMDGRPVSALVELGGWMRRNPRAGAGTPDLKPNNPRGTKHPCTNGRYQSSIVCAPAVQAPDYSTDATDSFEDSFQYAVEPAPDGWRASFLTFSRAVGPGPNAFTFAEVSRSIDDHPIPNTARPWSVTSSGSLVRKVSLTSPIRAGKDASLTVNVSPSASCSIAVVYDGVASKAEGLDPKSGGKITWRWRVRAGTRPGSWPVVVRCGKSGTLKVSIRVLPG